MRRRPGALLAALATAVGASGLAPAAAPAAPPRVDAASWVLVEETTGRVLAARRPDSERPIASATKLMTVLVALERRRLRDVLVIPPYAAAAAESRVGLVAGERMRVGDLVTATLLPSANDAAHALAVRVGGSRPAFVELMNARARRLGLTHTSFSTPVGLDSPANFSSARDLAALARVLRRRAFVRRVADRPRAVLRSGARPRVVLNRNRLVRSVPWVDGLKTGHTLGAGYVLVGSARQGGLRLVSVVLGTPSEAARDAASLALLRWGRRTFAWAEPVRRGQRLARLPVRDQEPDRVGLVARGGLRRLLARADRVRVRVDAPADVAGPLPRGAIVGHALVTAGGRRLARIDLLTDRAVPSLSFTTRVLRALDGPGIVVLAVGLAVGSSLFLVLRRPRRRSRAKTA